MMYRPTKDSLFKCSAEAIMAQFRAYEAGDVVTSWQVKMGAVVWDGLGGSGVTRPLDLLLWMDNIAWCDEQWNGCNWCGADFEIGNVAWYGEYPLCEECANAHHA
jgi:hypothetical protein